jgi:hypothetical protein
MASSLGAAARWGRADITRKDATRSPHGLLRRDAGARHRTINRAVCGDGRGQQQQVGGTAKEREATLRGFAPDSISGKASDQVRILAALSISTLGAG